MTKINVTLGITLCTNEETRNFLRMGIDALDIDVDGDVEMQAQAAMVAGIQVMKILDEGLMEQVEDIVGEMSGTPTRLRDSMTEIKQKMMRLETRTIPNIVDKVKELVVKVNAQPALAVAPEEPVTEETAPAAEETAPVAEAAAPETTDGEPVKLPTPARKRRARTQKQADDNKEK